MREPVGQRALAVFGLGRVLRFCVWGLLGNLRGWVSHVRRPEQRLLGLGAMGCAHELTQPPGQRPFRRIQRNACRGRDHNEADRDARAASLGRLRCAACRRLTRSRVPTARILEGAIVRLTVKSER